MEDVWVWDKNRPSRIIPRADVHTTQDVTVEELKPIDDVPTTLPPDFVAPPPDERREPAEPPCCSRSTSATRTRSSASTTASA